MREMPEINLEILYSGDFQYTLTSVNPHGRTCLCAVDIVRYDNGAHCVMMAEHKKNQGISVTNACDRIATQLYARFLAAIPVEKIVWLEHCPAGRMHKAHLDLIQFQHDGPRAGPFPATEMREVVFSNPRWKRFFESRHIAQAEFLKAYGYILKELCNAHMIFAVEDKSDYYWRVWANQEGFFIVSANPSAALPGCMLDVHGVSGALKENQHLFGSGSDMEEQFTTALMKGFLNKGL